MHQSHLQPQPPLLSARQVQSKLGVDRSTVYRMAEDGRLPAVKVGRQWRFPADLIDDVLRVDAAPRRARSVPTGSAVAAPQPDVAASVAQIAADLLGVMMVVTDMDGQPITSTSRNPRPLRYSSVPSPRTPIDGDLSRTAATNAFTLRSMGRIASQR